MATTTQAKYDAAVKKYWKAKTDAVMKKNNVTIKDAKTWYDTESWWVWRVSQYDFLKDKYWEDAASSWAAPSQKAIDPTNTAALEASKQEVSSFVDRQKAADAARARARRKARRLKKQYKLASKKAGGSENLLRVAERKYWVNSKEYRAVKAKVNKYEKPVSTVKEVTKKEDTTPISSKKWLTTSQYNALLKKYWDAAWVIAAAKAQFWANSSQVKKVQDLLSDFTKTRDVKKVRENIVITDATIKDAWDSFKWIDPTETEAAVFAKNWKQRVPVAEKFWIKNYTWTASQNILLRKKLRKAKKETDLEKTQRESGITPEKQAEFDKQQAEWDQKLRNKWIDPETWETIAKKDTEKKIKTNEKNLKALKKLRLSDQTDTDLLKRIEGRFGKDSPEYRKLKAFMKENPLADSTEWVDSELLEKSKEELDKAQIDSLEAARDENIANTAENFIKWSEVIAGNNEELQTFYKNMATELKTFIEENKKRRQKALQRTKDSELNRVVGQIRATLARRWVRIGNIPPEQLIAMSGELWAEAMRRIDAATTEMENAVAELTERKTAEINKLMEQWLIKQGEADASIEQMRQLKNKMIADIKANFVANTFKITQAAIADADKNKAETLNTISTFVTQLGISWAAQWVMENYLDAADSIEALENMIRDLNDTNSELFKAVDDAAKAAQLSAEFKAKIELMKATKSSSSSSWSTTRKIGEATMRALLAEWVPNASGYTTYWELEAAMNANPELKEKITTAISKANAISVSDSDT